MNLRTLQNAIGCRFWGAMPADWHSPNACAQKALTTCLDWAAGDRTGNLILSGAPGRGKTMLAAITVGKLLSLQPRPSLHWIHWVKLMSLCFSAATHSDSGTVRLDDLATPGVLLIDDLCSSERELSPSAQEQLNWLCDYRYARRLPLVCTLNSSGKGQIREQVGSRIYRRLTDGATIITAEW